MNMIVKAAILNVYGQNSLNQIPFGFDPKTVSDLMSQPGHLVHQTLHDLLKQEPMQAIAVAQLCLLHNRLNLACAILESGVAGLLDLEARGKSPVANGALYRTELWLQRMLLGTTGQLIDVRAPGFALWALQNRETISNRSKDLAKCLWSCCKSLERGLMEDPSRSLQLAAVLTALESGQAKYFGDTGITRDVWKQIEFFDESKLSDEEQALMREILRIHADNARVAAIQQYRKSSFARWIFSPFYDVEKYALKEPNISKKSL